MSQPATVLPVSDPRHGRYAGYQAGCRLVCCTEARRVYDLYRRYDEVTGKARMVPADAARRHIEWCRTWGVHFDAFGAASRSAPRILAGLITQIHATTEKKILAVAPEPGVNCYPAFSASRRLRSLIALGHPQALLSESTGLSEPRTSMLITGYRCDKDLSRQTWATVDRTFRALSMTPGDSNRSRLRAQRRGWVPPLAYDDIDDPADRPSPARALRPRRGDVDEANVLRVMAYRVVPCTVAERREVTRRWVEAGRALRELEQLTGWKVERYGKASDMQVAS